jgi:UDP-2,4-diacetamido-2,4,6-trideoxy-beta-L-altropyranose hydrolase
MGTGHVMRCLAVAQAWQDGGGESVFAMAESTPAVDRRLQEEGMRIAPIVASAGTSDDATQTWQLAGKNGATWIVVDGYNFGSEYQRAIKAAGFKLLFVDDNVHAETYCADLVLNQNIHARASLYGARHSSTHLLLGPRYAMLRREFRQWRNWRREIPASGRKILVTMGGSDPNNLTAKVIEAVGQLSRPGVDTIVLAGGSNPHVHLIEASIPKESMRLITDAIDVPEWMTWADVAVAGAGTTFWEMCFLGLPGILLVLAENQEGVAAAAERMGVASSLGKGEGVSASAIADKLMELLNSREARASQSDAGRRLVDGRGAERVVAFLSGLQLRRTLESDCEVFWEWANDPEVRAASFRCKPISWESHAEWFRTKLADPNAILYTVTNKDHAPVGELRYQIEGKRAVLSISLGAHLRGRGFGRKMLAVGSERFFQDSEVESIEAYVKPSNQASLRLFAGAGFLNSSSEMIEGQEAVRFVLKRSASA